MEVSDLGPPLLGTSLSVTSQSQGSRDSVVDTEEVDFAGNVSQTNKQLDETTVTATQVRHRLSILLHLSIIYFRFKWTVLSIA